MQGTGLRCCLSKHVGHYDDMRALQKYVFGENVTVRAPVFWVSHVIHIGDRHMYLVQMHRTQSTTKCISECNGEAGCWLVYITCMLQWLYYLFPGCVLCCGGVVRVEMVIMVNMQNQRISRGGTRFRCCLITLVYIGWGVRI